MTKKALYTLSAIIFILLMAFITLPPVTKMLERVEPHILGMPFFQFFLLAVPVTLACWLIVWFLLECRIEDREGGKKDE
ncbi:MAG: hypothetical protein LBO70_01855 [Clostridiales Family XIII bacterium]|jgi:hypothetical protein|nr:hypothetical protein [Clostridiales Family XIII bacterium]